MRSSQKLLTFSEVGLERALVTVLLPSKPNGFAPACWSNANMGDILLPGRSVIYAPVFSLTVWAAAAYSFHEVGAGMPALLKISVRKSCPVGPRSAGSP